MPFNEQTLRDEIAATWGDHGAHMEVYDALLAAWRSTKSVAFVVVHGYSDGTGRSTILGVYHFRALALIFAQSWPLEDPVRTYGGDFVEKHEGFWMNSAGEWIAIEAHTIY